MAKRYTSSQFEKMPWKNGKGETLELMKLPHELDPERFHLRLSIAGIKEDGPFSLFPGIDRTLLILSGDGLRLHFNDRTATLSHALIPFHFLGEDEVRCELLRGPVRDFNIMLDRDWGTAYTEVLQSEGPLACLEDGLIIFDTKNLTLDVLDRGEMIDLKDPDHKKIVIRIRRHHLKE